MRIPLINIILLLVLSALVDWYIIKDIRKYSPARHRKSNAWIYGASMLLTWGLLIAALCIPKRSEDKDIIPLMWILFTYVSILVPKMVYCLCSLIGRLLNRFTKHHVNYGVIAGGTLAVLIFISIWWGVAFTRHEIEVKRVEARSDRLPAGFDGYKVVQFSDIHVGTWGNDTTFISNLVDSINNLNPDVILFTGDIVNRRTEELQPFLAPLSRLRAKDGVYSILGNHDYGDYIDWKNPADKVKNLDMLKEWQKNMGWKMLNNSRTWLRHENDSISLIGVENWGEPPFKQYGNLHKALASGEGTVQLNDSTYKLLMTHNPEHWNQEVRKISDMDLTLSGHTHAMQIEVDVAGHRYSPAVWRYPYWGGLYDDVAADGNPMRLYVNIGAGEVAMPMRIGATPEVTLITLKSGKKKK